MLKFQLLSMGVCALAVIFSCQNAPTPAPAAKLATVSSQKFEKSEGKDCDKPAGDRTNCATIKLSYPKIEAGSEALSKNATAWAQVFLKDILYGDTSQTATLEGAMAGFFKNHQEQVKENENFSTGNFNAETFDTVLLNDGKHMTLQMDAFVNIGGVHGNFTSTVATFDCATGKKLTWDDLITDKAALQALAEKKFMETRADIFKPTDGTEPYKFDDVFQFKLPQAFGLVADGIYFNYVPYEVGPYAIGGTQFVLPFTELGALFNLKK